MKGLKGASMALVAMLSLGAQAADVKNYQASTCEVVSGDNYKYSQYFGYIQNNSTTNKLVVTCPLVRDDTIANNTASNGWIRVRDQHSTENVRCVFYRVSSTGTSASGSVKYSAGTSFTTQKLTFNNLNEGPTEDTMHMYCEVPAKQAGASASGVYSYSTNEL
ncbi:hypothetical protein [Endozoicomonas arenosclerae]|uniref:hypothetical protein n=1 Tax=Endozoicomonas arenosclerae TaxID=1633495 RepID=UPI0007838C5D|nr:hypothetical protein [Endozoicomonas arenosclerae]